MGRHPVYEMLTVRGVLESGLRHGSSVELLQLGPRGWERLTYSRLAGLVEALAAGLEELGVRGSGEPGSMGDRVATLGWNTFCHLAAYLAVPMMGAVLHPVNVRLAPLEIVYILNHARDRVLLVHRDFLGLLERIASKLEYVEHVVVYSLDEGYDLPSRLGAARVHSFHDIVSRRGGYEWPWLHEDTPAAMSYTSGTTGMPKGVVHTHRQLVLHALSLALHLSALLPDGYRLGRGSVVLQTVPMFHAYGWGLPYVSTLLALGQVYAGRFRASRYLDAIEGGGVTHSAGVPTVLKMLLDAAEEEGRARVLEGLVWMTGGSALPRGLAERARRLGVKIVGSYGMTEAAPVLTVSAVASTVPPGLAWEKLALTAGLPLPFTSLRVVDEEGRGWGRVEARSPWIARGYYRDPERTERAWQGGWFHTGDLGFLDEHGYLVIMDREKDVIKSGGEWISSLRLEALISTHPCVSEAAVVAAYHPKWQERPVAVVAPRPGCSVSEEEIKRHLQRFVEEGVIPRWWLPDRVVVVDELPKTSVGKIDKKRLREMYRGILAGEDS